MKLVRIKYWYDEGGYYTYTGLMSLRMAKEVIGRFEQAEIIESEEYEH